MSPESIKLESGEARAIVSTHGAELIHWSVCEQALLWTPQAPIWNETAPVLFPVVGWTNKGEIRVAGLTYPLGLHGFARHSEFVIIDRKADEVTLHLTDDPITRALYPFSFSFFVTYRLTGNALETVLEVENRGAEPMPYACGLHPGFAWPFAGGTKSDYRARFGAPEDPHVPVITDKGLFTSERRPIALEGHDLALSDALFAREALCFLNACSRLIAFEAPTGQRLDVAFENFAHIALWSRPGAPFLCIETWTGHGDPDGFAGELHDKPSMLLLQPAARAKHLARFSFQAG
jgi:galactose mutarotase-like enzyme